VTLGIVSQVLVGNLPQPAGYTRRPAGVQRELDSLHRRAILAYEAAETERLRGDLVLAGEYATRGTLYYGEWRALSRRSPRPGVLADCWQPPGTPRRPRGSVQKAGHVIPQGDCSVAELER
jgi:hypothetical protein